MKIPFYSQSTGYTCGPATLQMVFAYLGKHETQKHLAKLLHTDPEYGTSHKEMIREANAHGFYCYVNKNSSIEEIRYFLSRKLPVIVNYTEPSSDEGHYSVVIGIKENTLVMHDPWNGRRFTISTTEFEERWHDSVHNAKNWIMVLSTDDLELGKQYAPHLLEEKQEVMLRVRVTQKIQTFRVLISHWVTHR